MRLTHLSVRRGQSWIMAGPFPFVPLSLSRFVPCVAGVVVLGVALAAGSIEASSPGSTVNLVTNADYRQRAADKPVGFVLTDDVEFRSFGSGAGGGMSCLILQSGKNLRGKSSDTDSLHRGSIAQTIGGLNAQAGRWFRFTIRGLPQENFSVGDGSLDMKVEFFAGDSGFDGKIKHIYPIIQKQRKDLGVNGDNRSAGAASWHTYQLEVMLPSPRIDSVRISVSFDHGNAMSAARSGFLITDICFVRIDGPEPAAVGAVSATQKRPDNLIPIGGRFFYKGNPGETAVPKRFDWTNADRLLYHDNVWSAPFAGSMSAWLRAGDLDLDGKLVEKDTFVPDNVTITFDDTSMIIHTYALPNHPTGKFPGENPNYIQEKDATYSIPLNPKENPNHVVTAADNSNRALNMGPIGIAINGVVFFNPFDAGSQDASNMMDYCCGHPAPDNTYHYHKYPICINSPWADEGNAHSPLIGWAFDGFPIYGPYVKANVLAKDAKGEEGLNEFNLHADRERGPHYQVTPGKFPYIIGGYWGMPDPRDIRRGRGRGGMGPPAL